MLKRRRVSKVVPFTTANQRCFDIGDGVINQCHVPRVKYSFAKTKFGHTFRKS